MLNLEESVGAGIGQDIQGSVQRRRNRRSSGVLGEYGTGQTSYGAGVGASTGTGIGQYGEGGGVTGGIGGVGGIGGSGTDFVPVPETNTPKLATSTGNLMGYDPTKLASGHNSPKYSLGRFFQGIGHTPELVAANWEKFVQSDPRFSGWSFSGKDKIRWGGQGTLHDDFKGATEVDIINSAGAGGRGIQWLIPDGEGGATVAGAGGEGGALASAIQQLIAAQTAQGAQAAGFNESIRNSILSRIEAAKKPVDPNDPIIQSQRRAYSSEQDRALAQGREAMAARAAVSGMPTGSMDAAVQSSMESLANDKSRYMGDAMATREQAKIDELQNLLSMGAGILTADEQNAVQREIANLRTKVDFAGIESGERIANNELELRRYGINTQNNQFNTQMGYNIGTFQQLMNQFIMNQMRA
jgi:hypothetical protein